jgi:hypothetical protein
MNLEEIRAAIADSTPVHWQILSGDAPTYIGRYVDRGSRGHEFVEHDQRAVYVADVDIGLAWGMTADPHNETVEPHWTRGRVQPSAAHAHVVEVLYHGQPVDREVYASVDNGHGIVPWPTPIGSDGALEVSAWQLALVELLRDLGTSVGVGSVQDYMRRFEITVG